MKCPPSTITEEEYDDDNDEEDDEEEHTNILLFYLLPIFIAQHFETIQVDNQQYLHTVRLKRCVLHINYTTASVLHLSSVFFIKQTIDWKEVYM